jgi:hypothetical protein
MRVLAAIVLALGLGGCAIAALPIAAQVPLWGAIATGTAATGMLTVTAIHDCKADNGCKAVSLPP